MSQAVREIAPAKLNLALHVRGKMPDGRHAIETVFAFCTDGDRVEADSIETEHSCMSLAIEGEFAGALSPERENLVELAWNALATASGVTQQTSFKLEKHLPVASGLGGGSADAGATLRLLTGLWQIDPAHAQRVAPALGSDVPACLLSLSMRGEGAGDKLAPIDLSELSGTPVLLVNPRVALSTGEVFARWDGEDRGPLDDWRAGRNDLEPAAISLAPQIGAVLAWMGTRPGADFVRMSGSGATCFALFEDEEARDQAAMAVPREWWRLATFLR